MRLDVASIGLLTLSLARPGAALPRYFSTGRGDLDRDQVPRHLVTADRLTIVVPVDYVRTTETGTETATPARNNRFSVSWVACPFSRPDATPSVSRPDVVLIETPGIEASGTEADLPSTPTPTKHSQTFGTSRKPSFAHSASIERVTTASFKKASSTNQTSATSTPRVVLAGNTSSIPDLSHGTRPSTLNTSTTTSPSTPSRVSVLQDTSMRSLPTREPRTADEHPSSALPVPANTIYVGLDKYGIVKTVTELVSLHPTLNDLHASTSVPPTSAAIRPTPTSSPAARSSPTRAYAALTTRASKFSPLPGYKSPMTITAPPPRLGSKALHRWYRTVEWTPTASGTKNLDDPAVRLWWDIWYARNPRTRYVSDGTRVVPTIPAATELTTAVRAGRTMTLNHMDLARMDRGTDYDYDPPWGPRVYRKRYLGGAEEDEEEEEDEEQNGWKFGLDTIGEDVPEEDAPEEAQPSLGSSTHSSTTDDLSDLQSAEPTFLSSIHPSSHAALKSMLSVADRRGRTTLAPASSAPLPAAAPGRSAAILDDGGDTPLYSLMPFDGQRRRCDGHTPAEPDRASRHGTTARWNDTAPCSASRGDASPGRPTTLGGALPADKSQVPSPVSHEREDARRPHKRGPIDPACTQVGASARGVICPRRPALEERAPVDPACTQPAGFARGVICPRPHVG